MEFDLMDTKIKEKIQKSIKISEKTSEKQEELAVLIRLQNFINDYINDINKIEKPEESIKVILKKILDIYDADRAYIIEVDRDLQLGSNTYEICDKNIEAEIEKLQNIELDSYPVWKEKLEKNEKLLLINIEKSKDKQYDLLKMQNINNLMATPFLKEHTTGFLGVDNPKQFIGKFEFLNSIVSLIAALIGQIRLQNKISASAHLDSLKNKNDVYIKTFGSFEIDMMEGRLTETDFNSKQCSNMLLYLLYHRNNTVSIGELAEIIWPNQIMEAPYSAIKNIAFRVRKICERISDAHLIVAKNGSYAWNEKMNVTVDYELFEQKYNQLKNEKNEDSKIKDCQELFDIYKGSILPNNENEFWILSLVSKYKMLYAEVVKTYLELLKKKNDYFKMFEIASKALKLEPLNSIFHYYLIVALIYQNKINIAKAHFYKCDKILNNLQIKELLIMFQTNE